MLVVTLFIACAVMAWAALRLRFWSAVWFSILLIALFSPAIWTQALQGYGQDSYWTLGISGRLGVLTISVICIALFYLALWGVFRPLPRTWRAIAIAGTGIVSFVVLHALTPQIFYSFYLLIFPDLPHQWVITGLPDPLRVRLLASISPRGTLSDHLAACAMWGVFPFAVWTYRQGQIS